jgi:hypothetical protein
MHNVWNLLLNLRLSLFVITIIISNNDPFFAQFRDTRGITLLLQLYLILKTFVLYSFSQSLIAMNNKKHMKFHLSSNLKIWDEFTLSQTTPHFVSDCNLNVLHSIINLWLKCAIVRSSIHSGHLFYNVNNKYEPCKNPICTMRTYTHSIWNHTHRTTNCTTSWDQYF